MESSAKAINGIMKARKTHVALTIQNFGTSLFIESFPPFSKFLINSFYHKKASTAVEVANKILESKKDRNKLKGLYANR
jgi:hypothetical protein